MVYNDIEYAVDKEITFCVAKYGIIIDVEIILDVVLLIQFQLHCKGKLNDELDGVWDE